MVQDKFLIYTLGPEGTNCANAARWWLDSKRSAREDFKEVGVRLFKTLEGAFDVLSVKRDGYLLSCAAYPDLHTLVFARLREMELFDSFVIPTHNMVIASKVKRSEIKSIATHPAPQSLAWHGLRKVFANSNADAACICRSGGADACVTTSVAANAYGLEVMDDFGAVPMAFLLHRMK